MTPAPYNFDSDHWQEDGGQYPYQDLYTPGQQPRRRGGGHGGWWVLAVLLALYPLLAALVLVIRDIRRAYRFAKIRIPEKVDAAVEKRREERLEKAFEKKEEEGKPDGGSEPS